ncbi:hypothetical protein QYE76_014277 [Lolium multiflorum]|uniref:C3H1-type domain-containing protein n=1 Tax=Lolium multiflorum TaxID=4521 RepID=A0AAD8X6M8_LOLMU|nr:hypothetical protein QYE76_014277 [Lolium multiflorum]
MTSAAGASTSSASVSDHRSPTDESTASPVAMNRLSDYRSSTAPYSYIDTTSAVAVERTASPVAMDRLSDHRSSTAPYSDSDTTSAVAVERTASPFAMDKVPEHRSPTASDYYDIGTTSSVAVERTASPVDMDHLSDHRSPSAPYSSDINTMSSVAVERTDSSVAMDRLSNHRSPTAPYSDIGNTSSDAVDRTASPVDMDEVPDHGSPTASGYAMGTTSPVAVERTAPPAAVQSASYNIANNPAPSSSAPASSSAWASGDPATQGSAATSAGGRMTAGADGQDQRLHTPLFYPAAAPSSYGLYEPYFGRPLYHGAPHSYFAPRPPYSYDGTADGSSSSYFSFRTAPGTPGIPVHAPFSSAAPPNASERMAAAAPLDLHVFSDLGRKLHRHLSSRINKPFTVPHDGDYMEQVSRHFRHPLPRRAFPLQPPASPNASVKQGDPKTQLCKHWMMSGICPFGNQCWFAHGESERLHAPLPNSFRTRRCRFGAECPYQHSPVKQCHYLH